jgi:hypothetical protein
MLSNSSSYKEIRAVKEMISYSQIDTQTAASSSEFHWRQLIVLVDIEVRKGDLEFL